MVFLLYIGCFLSGYALAMHITHTYTSNNLSQTQKVGNNSFSIQGNSINMSNGKIVVDGKVIKDGINNCTIDVTVEGDCHDITTSNGDITVHGNIKNNVKTTNGDIAARNGIGGNVTTNNGDVDCVGSINGNVSTNMGDITHK